MADDSAKSRPPTPMDPFAAWREWLALSEQQMNRAFNDLMGTEQFARASGSWVEAMTTFQQTFQESAERYLELAHIPSRSDVASLAERMTAIEQRLERVEVLLTAAMGRGNPPDEKTPRPPRTRRPPSKQPAVTADPPRPGSSEADAE